MPGESFVNPITGKIVCFLREIGLEVRMQPIDGPQVVEGVDIEHGVLIVDQAKLLQPGDVLHEAGHLAVAEPARRAAFHHDVGNIPAEEMMAIAWSYAAALHVGIDPLVVFHGEGYRGFGADLAANFNDGRYIAHELLAYVGMTHAGKLAPPKGAKPYPAMVRWLRP